MLYLSTDEHISVFAPGQVIAGSLEQRLGGKAQQLRLSLRCFTADGFGQKYILWQDVKHLDVRAYKNSFSFHISKDALLSSQGPLFSIAWELFAERCRFRVPCQTTTLEILLLAPDILAVERLEINRLGDTLPMQGRPAWRFFWPKYCLGLQQHARSFRLSWYWRPGAWAECAGEDGEKNAEFALWQGRRYRGNYEKQRWRALRLPLTTRQNSILLTLPQSWPLPLCTPLHEIFYRLTLEGKVYHWPQRAR